MGRKSFNDYRKDLNVDQLIAQHRAAFDQACDPRNRLIGQSMGDILQSAFAMFHLKFPSLLDFDSATVAQRANLQRIYGIKSLCSDTQMRRMIDRVSPHVIHDRMTSMIAGTFRQVGGWRQFEVLDGRITISLDGVQHFQSARVHCPSCLERESSRKGTTYAHQLLVGSVVHPRQKTVFPAVAEPIVKQDGAGKNDCERTAAGRVIAKLTQAYPAAKLLIVADGLYSCGPVIKGFTEAGYDFVITAKPGDHQSLFRHFATWQDRNATHTRTANDDGGVTHHYRWANGLGLNQTWANMKLNVLQYEQVDRGGKKTRLSWVTNRRLTKRNVEQIMRIGRSRWKVENETFNTLKNQGYHFEHNYGHGYEHLCSTLAHIMLLAFLTDQLVELCSEQFQHLLKAARTRVKIWFQQRALFTSASYENFASIHGRLAELFGVQII